MKGIILVCSFIELIGFSRAQIVQDGQCEQNIQLQPNFNLTEFLGTWYEIARSPISTVTTQCSSVQLTSTNDTLEFFSSGVNKNFLEERNGVAVQGTGATFTVTTDGSSTEYSILSTDYTNYALAYRCENLTGTQRNVFIWQLGRTSAAPTAQILNTVNATLQNLLSINVDELGSLQHTGNACLQLPVIPSGQPIILDGQCPTNVDVVQAFNVSQFMGTWHEIASYPSDNVQGTCARAQYDLNGNVVDVLNSQVINETLFTINGTASVASADGSAVLSVVLNVLPGVIAEQTLYIIATDYVNYAVSYACENVSNDTMRVYSWILGKSPILTEEIQQEVDEVVESRIDLNYAYYQDTPRTPDDCFYFPDYDPTKPVIYRGKCEEDIAAMPNFEPEKYMGLWHQIESFPSNFQSGSCSNANYTLGDVVEVYNTQVIDQTLDTINGVAIIDPQANGTGKLIVSFPIAGTNETTSTNYWILFTDYVTYSIVYSCTDLDDDKKMVIGWKLSRAKQLTQEASIAIDNTISGIKVLDQRYFGVTDQSPEGCFYYPDLSPTEPVILPNMCEENVTPVNNFMPALFAGRWIDVESYYDEYTGSCGEITFMNNGLNFDITTTQVVNQEVVSVQGNATIASDGTGKFTVTDSRGVLDYYVLATDYSGYALLYSCVNIDNSTRQVRAQKLSRQKQLTVGQQNQINNAMSNIVALDNRYFNAIDQSESSCFFYPEYVPGKPVVYKGKCDLNVTTVQPFVVESYLGLWYDIEHYPQDFQLGACATAEYSPGVDVVNVYNTEVVNQQLSTINGTAVVASDDGSAKLTVSFPVFGVPGVTTQTPYWVLATDYVSYSLVYSCVDIDDESYRVTVWKMSRTTNLTQNAIQAIDNVMEQVPVIRQQYFEETGHTAEDCFYYPDNFGGPVTLEGQCPTANQVNVVPNFNSTSFSGLWHEAARYPSQLQTGECSSTNFESSSGNSYIITQANVEDERLNEVNGTGTISGDGNGIITAVFTNPNTGVSTTLTLYVLATNYNDYALVYSCQNLNANTKQLYSWQLTRTRDGLSQVAIAAINEQISSNIDLFEGYYETVDQSNDACFYYPTFTTPPENIELPGPCPTSISGVPAFIAGDYLGRWYEIESYPQLFQNGDCARADYSPGDDGVVVYNTQVVNQTLDIMIGSAVVSSSDGTGQLNVTFVVGGVTNYANYYILATDYTNYALVYSCRNLDNGKSQVSSWKLSRNTTLSPQANNIMNNVIQNTQGLLQEYYTPTSQSDEACFYIPELVENEPAEFRGTCELNLPLMQNFNVQQYLGWWHEIERYPSNNAAQCTSSQFGSAGNGYQVVDVGVSGGVGTYSTVSVVASADGKLTRTYPDGTVVETWVLATDYQTYSLLYSCENIVKNDEPYRRVWSAKHSKTRSLTDAAQNQMAPTIANISVLVPQFYLKVDQSNEACFHHPEQTGPQIILPGNCEENIPVVNNFQIPDYSGTWYQIERYPQIHETGECTGARYELDESAGVVNVLNWEVVDGNLETIEGTAVPTYDDGTARLTVTLPVLGTNDTVTTPLYVLTTDYVSYSLAYSCVNLNEYQRILGVWKLSRQRTMPASGVTAINAYMATRNELHQPYFLQVTHNEDCPEPSGSFVVKSSVIVILVCALLQLLR